MEVELNEKLEFMIMEAAMRLLFKMDKKDYEKCTHSFVRNSARSIMIKGKK